MSADVDADFNKPFSEWVVTYPVDPDAWYGVFEWGNDSMDGKGNDKDSKGNGKDDKGNDKDSTGNGKDDTGKGKDGNGNGDRVKGVYVMMSEPGIYAAMSALCSS